jgi:hypothetical protein
MRSKIFFLPFLLFIFLLACYSFVNLKGAQEPKLTLVTPSHVDASQIPLVLSYTAENKTNVTVDLEIKQDGSAEYQQASIAGERSFEMIEGENNFKITWDKGKDQIAAGKTVDLRLTAVDGEGKKSHVGLTRLRFETREALRNRIDNYIIYYGKWTDSLIQQVKQRYQLVILDARSGVTPQQVAEIRAGSDPNDASDDVLVLAYLSVGEDLRTSGMTVQEMKNDRRFVLGGTGPSVDPRPGAPFPLGAPILGDIEITGKPTKGGFAPFYLNDNFATFGKIGAAGTPDINTNFKAAFVNPGYPEWFNVLQEMKQQKDGVPGIKELLSSGKGQLGSDGLLLDTLDTAAPNSFTSGDSTNQGQFEWVAPGTKKLIESIREAYPNTFLLANRGLFFYNPDLTTYPFTLRGLVDFVLFESFQLDSSSEHWFDESIFNDNKYNYAQKLLAEADRSDGFRVLSLGYTEGPQGDLIKKAAAGEQNTTTQLLQTDLQEAGNLGMVHFITNGKVNDFNTFASDHRETEIKIPTWGSTVTPTFGKKPSNGPREGIQNVEIRGKDVFVQWDVAHSNARPISYTLYVKEGLNFDFNGDLNNQGARLVPLHLGVPANYAGPGDRSKRYPYEDKVEGLTPGKDYYFLIRAANKAGKFEGNQKTIKVTAP